MASQQTPLDQQASEQVNDMETGHSIEELFFNQQQQLNDMQHALKTQQQQASFQLELLKTLVMKQALKESGNTTNSTPPGLPPPR